jgi:hypothetical protein
MLYNAVLDVQFFSETTTEPVTQSEITTYLKLSSDNEITLAVTLAKVARQMCEVWANISIKYRGVRAIVNNSLGGIQLPYGPYVSGLIVKDIDGNVLDHKTTPLLGTQSFVQLITPNAEYLQLEYYAGFSFDNGTNVNYPQWAKTAVLQQTAYMFANRGDNSFGMDNMAKQTLSPYKRIM